MKNNQDFSEKTYTIPLENEEIIRVAVTISENIKPPLKVNEKSFFIKGFLEAIKYLKQ